MKADKEVDDILEFIETCLDRIKTDRHGDLKDFAKSAGLSSKNLTDFRTKYGRGSNPLFRTTYKILRSILRRPPINLTLHNLDDLSLQRISRIKDGEFAEAFAYFLEVFSDYEFTSESELHRVMGTLETLRNLIREKKDTILISRGE